MTKKLILALAALLAFAPSAPAQTLNKNVQKTSADGTLTESLSTGNKTITVASGGTITFSSGSNLTVEAGATVTGISGSGTGDVNGPASATDDAVARFDSTTGKLLQNSSVTISDAGILSGVSELLSGGSVISGTVSGLPGIYRSDAGLTVTRVGAGGSAPGHAMIDIYHARPGVSGGSGGTAGEESVVNFSMQDAGGTPQQLGSFSMIWADATAGTGRSQWRIHANHLAGGSNSDLRGTGDGGIDVFGASDTSWPGDKILRVYGLLNMASGSYGSPTSGTYTTVWYSSGSDTGVVQAYDYTASAYKPLTISGSVVDVSIGTLRAKANATVSSPASGKGLEFLYRIDAGNDYAAIISYDRSLGALKPLRVDASTVTLAAAVAIEGTVTATAATSVIAAVSSGATGQAQIQARNATNRAMTVGVFGDSASGTTFGRSNVGAAYFTTATTGGGAYPTSLLIGTQSAADVVFGANGTEVGYFNSSVFNLSVPITNGTATTPAANDNDTSIATTAFVQAELTDYASDTATLSNKSFALGSNTLTGTSAQLATALSDETGSGAAVFATSPALAGPRILPSSGTAIGRIVADPARADVFLVSNNYNGTAQDDSGKPSWYHSFDSRVAGDAWKVFRAPPGASVVEMLTVDATGTTAHGLLRAGTSPTTLTDTAGKILSASLNTVGVGQGGTGTTTAPSTGQLLVASGSTAYAPVTMSGNATIGSDGVVTIANSGVTAGSYTSANITVGADGRITAASNGSGSSGWSTGLLFTTTASAIVIDNSTTETTIFSGTIPGGTLGTQGAVKVIIHGIVKNDSGTAQGLTFRVKYGATTLYADATSASAFGNSATPRAYNIELYLWADNSASAQRLGGVFGPFGASAVATSGYGDLAATSAIMPMAFGGTSAEDSTGDLTLDITAQLTAASVSYEFTVHKASAWKL